MALVLWPFWYQRGYYREARICFEQMLRRAPDITPARRARVLVSVGEVAFLQCDYATAEDTSARLGFGRRVGDQRAAATALQRLGSIAREQGRYDDARDLHERSLSIWEELGDEGGVAASNDYLGFVAWLSGDSQTAEAHCALALAAFKRSGDLRASATALVNLGACALYRGELEPAHQRLEEALATARRLGFQEAIAWALHELAIADRHARRTPHETASMLREALLVHRGLGDRWRAASVLEEIVGSVLVRHDPQRGVEILAAADALREQLGTPIPPVEAPDREAARSALERRLTAATFASAWADGRARELDTVVDLAVEDARRAHRWRRRRSTDRRSGADPPRAIGARAAGRGSHQPRDRRRPVHQPQHRRGPRVEHPAQARGQTARRRRRHRAQDGPAPDPVTPILRCRV